jgi:hypothetical protein
MLRRIVSIALLLGSLGFLMGTDSSCFIKGRTDDPTVIVNG